jgi:heme/copper-type cytochrome/quinol oxidase subunit 3
VFLGFQVYEFTSFVHEGLTLQTNLFGSTFFILTGFHGGHVLIGVLWLVTLLVYWHFVDVVWIVIFTVVYLLQ